MGHYSFLTKTPPLNTKPLCCRIGYADAQIRVGRFQVSDQRGTLDRLLVVALSRSANR